MKVLHTYKIYKPDVEGGIPEVISSLLRLPENIQNSVLVARKFGRKLQYISEGAPVEAVTCFGTMFSTPIAPTYPYIFHKRVRDSDLIVHHMPFPLVDLALIKPILASKALIVFWHAEIVNRAISNPLLQSILSNTLRYAHRVIVADESSIANSSLLDKVRHKCSIIPYGVDTDYWCETKSNDDDTVCKLRQRHPRLVLAVGRHVSYKGFDVLLKAMSEVDGDLVFIGEGVLTEELQRLSRELGIEDRVFWLGRLKRDDIRNYMRAARVLAFPSITVAEAFGLVQLEAMSTGLPVINTSLPTAVPKIARNGFEGLTVTPGNVAELATAIRRILNDREYGRMLGLAGQVRVRAKYTHGRFETDVENVYYQACAAARLDQC